MKSDEQDSIKDYENAPLIGTLRFVFVLGISFAVLWYGMYALLRGRW